MKIRTTFTVMCAALLVAAAASAQDLDFQKSSDYQKLDGRTRQAWADAMRAGDSKRMLECMVKVSERLNQSQKNQLAASGFKPGSIIQTIVTGSVAAGDVPKLAKLGFVKVVELAVPLSIKTDPGYSKYGAPRKTTAGTAAASPAPATAAKQTKAAAAVKPAAETSIEREEAIETGAIVQPAYKGEVVKEVPIYQTAPTEPTYPNRPPTSPETPSEEPAIAPVDQAPVIVEQRPTLTEPVIEPPKPEPVPQPELVPPPAPAQQPEQPQPKKYAPTQ